MFFNAFCHNAIFDFKWTKETLKIDIFFIFNLLMPVSVAGNKTLQRLKIKTYSSFPTVNSNRSTVYSNRSTVNLP